MLIRKRKPNKSLVWFGVLFSVCLMIFPFGAGAVVLYLNPSNGQYQPGDTFIVEIRIDSEGEAINTVEANLSFSQDILEVVDFSYGNSILTLWLKTPIFDQNSGQISFIGGIPGGYKTPKASPANLLGKIIFKVPEIIIEKTEKKSAKVKFLNTTQVLLNDGLGTEAKLITQGATFEILSKLGFPKKDQWFQELEKDNILPESFEVGIYQEPTIFEGKYFIVFSTTDKQTGISHYEVKEGKRDWKRGESPYLLEDQSLKSIIEVKAVDKAGNERIIEAKLPKKPFPYWIIILVIILVGIVIIWIILRRIKSRK